MEALFQNQRIQRRRTSVLTIAPRKSLLSAPVSPRIIPRLKTQKLYSARLPFYLAGLLFIVSLSCIAPQKMVFWKTYGLPRNFALPEDPGLEELLSAYAYPNYDSGEDEGDAVSLPQGRILSSVSFTKYKLGKGETLAGVAAKMKTNLDTLISVNKIRDVKRIVAGTELLVPNINGILYTVKRGNSLSGIAQAHGITLNAILDANNMQSAVIQPGQELFIPGASMNPTDLKRILGELFIYPTTGRLTSKFGMRNDPFTNVRRFHNGIDIANSIGTPVRAAMEGKVAMIGTHDVFGKYIILSHSDGYQTLYAHLDTILISKGERVNQGQKVAEMGNSGYSTGSHLHFSVFKRGEPLDPLKFLK